MARHRNIRFMRDDDIAVYDEPLGSSVDDDYAISPNTEAQYLYNPEKRNIHALSAFIANRTEPLSFSSEDFPDNKQFRSVLEDNSPTDISGRIHPKYTYQIPQYVDPCTATAIHNENSEIFHTDVQPPDQTNFATETNSTKDLVESLSNKLNLGQQKPIHSDNVARTGLSNDPSITIAPTSLKSIDRRLLMAEYGKRQNESGNKEIVNLIVLGHVDAGKSTLMGNLLCQLGHVSGKQLAKYQWEAQKLGKSSFAYAWVLDQTSEERNRGVTMDIAQTSFETKTKRIAVMDAPGHKDFVPRVIGGASQADAALLVINATKGEFETGIGQGGQTREHTKLARLLGVPHIIVTVNKMDTVNWDKERFDEIKSKINGLLKSMNFAKIVYCPVSGLIGTNLTSPTAQKLETDAKLFDWYSGPCLLDLIDSIPSPDRVIDGPFRFVVSDIFKPLGSSVPAVAGRVVSGAISAGVNLPTSKVMCQPSDVRATVKAMKSLCTVRTGPNDSDAGDLGSRLLDHAIKYAFAGDQVVLMLSDIDPFQSLAPGDLITDPDNPISLASRIRAKLLVFSVKQPLTKGYPVIFYYHYTSVTANVSKLNSMTNRENKVQHTLKKPRCLLGNCTADVELTFERPICLELYEKCKPLGRFMLRSSGESIAGGTVTKILPPRKNRLTEL